MHCKGEAQKSPIFWRFSGGFWFSQDRLFSRNSTRKPLNLIKSPIFTNAPCQTACLYNAPSMHTVDVSLVNTGNAIPVSLSVLLGISKGVLFGIVEKVFSPKGVPRIFDAILTHFWRILAIADAFSENTFWTIPIYALGTAAKTSQSARFPKERCDLGDSRQVL